MTEKRFIKKYWEEDDIWFIISFENSFAVKQVEISGKGKVFLSEQTPIKGDSMLYDQSIDELNLNEKDFITEIEFNEIWNNNP